jgi:membrane-associated phospholipid phosphatase
MDWITAADLALFRRINEGIANPVLDVVMPFLSGNALFRPAVALLAAWLLCRGGRRGRAFVVVLALSLALGETLTGELKRGFGRPRPFVTHPETRMLAGKGGMNGSMPSGHSAIWAATAMIAGAYFRRSRPFMIPLAFGVGLSRCYVGVHYPTDVLAGWGWGAAYGWALPRLFDRLWGRIVGRWFPAWHARLPSILPAGLDAPAPATATDPAELERHWRRLTWTTLGALLAARLAYLAAGVIELSEDEAYQWLWSKHPDWSYYSKPPFIAYAQWIGTRLFGDTELGVRCLAPVLSFLASLGLSGFVARFAGWRTGFLYALATLATPLLAVGSILMTIDPLAVAFWTLAMLAGWRAIREDSTRWWLLTGMGLGGAFLSKYFSPFLWASFAVFFLVHPPARARLRSPGPWLALGINALAAIPVLAWNAAHGWITFRHLQERGGLDRAWSFRPNFVTDFVAAALGLMNPVFLVGIVWAAAAFVASRRNGKERDAADEPASTAMTYALCMGAPVFLFYLAYTLRARVQPNWIATAIPALMVFATLWWSRAHVAGGVAGRRLLTAGLALGLPVTVLLHETRLLQRALGVQLPMTVDPLRRVRGYREAAAIVSARREELLAEGRPVRVVADHYGRAGLLSFYMPEARRGVPDAPVVTVRESDVPENQLWFWPKYRYLGTPGLTVLFVQEEGKGGFDLDALRARYATFDDLGTTNVAYHGRVFRTLHMYVGRDQR